MKEAGPVLYVFSGLPAAGKSTIARKLAEKLKAAYIRTDTIEQGLRDLCGVNVRGEGYRLAYRIAADNLTAGISVVSDQCNPWLLTRNEWNGVAAKYGRDCVNIEVLCSDREEHKKRAENRTAEIDRPSLPSWKEITGRESDKDFPLYYQPWEGEHITIDTAHKNIDECIGELLEKINKRG